jgi:hypothetical protein
MEDAVGWETGRVSVYDGGRALSAWFERNAVGGETW